MLLTRTGRLRLGTIGHPMTDEPVLRCFILAKQALEAREPYKRPPVRLIEASQTKETRQPRSPKQNLTAEPTCHSAITTAATAAGAPAHTPARNTQGRNHNTDSAAALASGFAPSSSHTPRNSTPAPAQSAAEAAPAPPCPPYPPASCRPGAAGPCRPAR